MQRYLACLQCRCLALHGDRKEYKAAHLFAGVLSKTKQMWNPSLLAATTVAL